MAGAGDLAFAPATADVDFPIGEWLFEAGPELFGYVLNGRDQAVRHLTAHWAMDEGIFSHRHAVLAWRGGAVVGLELGLTAVQKERHLAPTIARFQADLTDAATMVQLARFQAVGPLLQDVPPDAYYVQHLVVAPAARGTGVGKALLQRSFATAAHAGLASVQLDIEISSPAQAFCLAQGMEAALELRIPRLAREHGISGVVRMVKRL